MNKPILLILNLYIHMYYLNTQNQHHPGQLLNYYQSSKSKYNKNTTWDNSIKGNRTKAKCNKTRPVLSIHSKPLTSMIVLHLPSGSRGYWAWGSLPCCPLRVWWWGECHWQHWTGLPDGSTRPLASHVAVHSTDTAVNMKRNKAITWYSHIICYNKYI